MLPLSDPAKPAAAIPLELSCANCNERNGVFSPNGKLIAYSSDETGKEEVYVHVFPPSSGGRWIVSNDGGSCPRWRRDGKELFYLAPDRTSMSVPIGIGQFFQAGFPRPLFQSDIVEDFRAGFAVDSDGQRFLIPTAQPRTSSSSATVVVKLDERHQAMRAPLSSACAAPPDHATQRAFSSGSLFQMTVTSCEPGRPSKTLACPR